MAVDIIARGMAADTGGDVGELTERVEKVEETVEDIQDVINDKFEQSGVAAAYDSSHTYIDGEYFTFEGELYIADSTADYITSENLVTEESKAVDGGYLAGQYPLDTSTTNDVFGSNKNLNTLGYISVQSNATYRFTPNGIYNTMPSGMCDAFYSDQGARIGIVAINRNLANNPRIFLAPGNAKYVRITLGNSNQMPVSAISLQRVYTDMPKARKTTLTELLNSKVNNSELATVAKSGSYNNLTNKPKINNVELDGSKSLDDIGVTNAIQIEVARIVADAPEDFDTLKEMSDWIANHEDDAAAMNSAIAQNTSDIVSLQNSKADISTTYTKSETDALLSVKANDNALAAVAKSGSYNDLTNKPTIPSSVSVTETGDITIGSQLVRKVITQTEYDALTTKDPKVEYLILEETETEGE